MMTLFEAREGATERLGPFQLWADRIPEPLPPGVSPPEPEPEAVSWTGKTGVLKLRKTNGDAVTVTGVVVPHADQVTYEGWFYFDPGVSDFTFVTGGFTNTTILHAYWLVTTTATGKTASYPDYEDAQVIVRRG